MARPLILLAAFAFTMISYASDAQVLNWTGTYVGAFGGFGTGTQGQHDNYTPPPVITPPPCDDEECCGNECDEGDGRYGISGALGGAVIGYSFPLSGITGAGSQLFGAYPFNQIVIGAEGDIAASSLSGSSQTCGASIGNPHACGGNIYMTSDLRARVGLPFGQFMPFFSAGLAVDDIHTYDSFFGVSATRLDPGWTVGGGLEYKITAQLGIRLEYLYQAFPRTAMFDLLPGTPEGIRTDVNIVRAGIVWDFAPPPPAGPPVIGR